MIAVETHSTASSDTPSVPEATVDAAASSDSTSGPDAQAVPDGVLFDDFSDGSLNRDLWLVAKTQWGGADENGGVVPANVRETDGHLLLEGHGDQYEGQIVGINKDGSMRKHGRRVGAAVASGAYFASGRYEVRAKIIPEFGVSSAFWTFHYQEYYPGDPVYEQNQGTGSYYAVNHEIDIELPGRPGPALEDISFERALCNTWTGERNPEYRVSYTDLSRSPR